MMGAFFFHQFNKNKIKIYLTIFFVVVFLLFGKKTAEAQFNPEINYQGKITNSSDAAVADGTYAVVFSLYTVSAGGVAIWTETQNITTVGGLFSVLLGSVSSLSAVNFNQDLYLGVNFNSDGEMSPRKQLGTVPSAFEAGKLDGLDSLRFGILDTEFEKLSFDGNNVIDISGANNFFAGIGTGANNTSGTDNTFIGSMAGNANISGVANVLVGSTAGSNLLGDNNTIIGNDAGFEITSGDENIFIGSSAGHETQGANENVFIGSYAGYSNVSSTGNVFIGQEAGYNSSAGGNTFVGYQSGLSNTGGVANVFLGYLSGNANTTGDGNTFLGYASGRVTTTGDANTFSGYRSGYSNTTASNNTFFGYDSGLLNNTGADNLFMGSLSGDANTTGSNNVFLGSSAGSANTTAGNNVFLGYNAGLLVTEGGNNTLLGYSAGDNLTTGTSNIILGSGVDAAAVDSVSTLNIGNTIYGNLATDRIGIGASPISSLHIYTLSGGQTSAQGMTIEADGAGDALLSFVTTGETRWGLGIDDNANDDFILALGDPADINQLGENGVLTVQQDGDVGIGDNLDPTAKLEVNAGTGLYALRVTRSGGVYNGTYVNEFRTSASSVVNGTLIHHAENQEGRNAFVVSSSFGTIATFESGGRVGIGDSDPDNGGLVVASGVVIGTDSTDYLIDDSSNGAASATLYIGNETIDTTVSDERLKTNIHISEGSALDFLSQFTVKSFDWLPENPRSELGPIEFGLIAQEVKTIAPQYIKQGENPDDFMSIRFAELTAVNIKAIQELDIRLAEIENNQLSAGSLDQNSVFNLLASSSDKIIGGVVSIVDAVIERLTVRKIIVQDQLCLGNVCITEAEFQNIVNGNQVLVNQNIAPEEDSDQDVTVDENTNQESTEEIIFEDENTETTDNGDEEEALDLSNNQDQTPTEDIVIGEEVVI